MILQARRAETNASVQEKKTEATAQPDDLISIRQLRGRRAATAVEVELDDEADITKGAALNLSCRHALPRSHTHTLSHTRYD
jgi:hypothetical protein